MKLSEEEIEKAAKLSLDNFGAAEDLWHPDYGWIMKNGQPTEIGKAFFKALQEQKDGE